MVVAERLQPGEPLVDLGLLCDEGGERGFLVALLGAQLVRGVVSGSGWSWRGSFG